MKSKVLNFLFFLLLLAPASLIVRQTNTLFYSFTQNSKLFFDLLSWFSLLFFATIFFLILYVIVRKISKNSFKISFKLIIFIILICLNYFGLAYVIFESPFTYKSCGKEFNELYILSAKSNDPSFCLNSDIKLNSYPGLKGGIYCKTPYKDSIEVWGNVFSGECITSFAKYTNDISHCELIAVNNLGTGGSSSSGGFIGNKYHCIMEFAIDKLNDSYCDLLPSAGEFSDRNQCLKTTAWRTNNKALCEKIPNNSSLKNACLNY
jgi:hypothetical protein